MAHRVKYGDERTLQWQLNADLTTASGVTVIISASPFKEAVIARAGTIVTPATGIVSLTLDTSDYGTGLLEAGENYLVEVEVLPGPVTFPECGYEDLTICYDLG